MRRGLWFVLGTGAGAYATHRARRVAESFTAEGLRDRVQGLSHGARLLREEARTGQQEKEAELRQRLGLPVTAPLPELTARRTTDAPAAPEPRPLHHPRRRETTD